MSEKTKIVVVHMKELLYTVIFTALVIILIIVLVYMFLPKSDDKTEQAAPPQTEGVSSTESVQEITEDFSTESVPETTENLSTESVPGAAETGSTESVPQTTEDVIFQQ